MEQIPYVSVIIPMYNAEKYIGELLESLLIQTLKNFEVIIVDDCSTDESFNIAKSYLPQFESRLKLMKLPTNSGSPSIPRNKGLDFSRGKYIFFMDNDDVILENTLEELYNFAEKFQADVVHCEKYFTSSGIGDDFINNIKIIPNKLETNKSEWMLSENIVDRANIWLQFKFGIMPWLSFTSRNFLIAADIKFRDLKREDVFWSFEVLLSAPKILCVANPYCVHRVDNNSMTTRNNTLKKYLGYWMDRTVNGLKLLEDFLLKIPFFKENPEARYTILNHWALGDLELISRACKDFEPHVLKENFQETFSKNLGDKDTLVAFLVANSVRFINELKKKN